MKTNAHIQEDDYFLSPTYALVIMDPYEPKAPMRFTASVSLNGLSAKANALITTSSSLNFVSKEFFMVNGFYTYCKIFSKMTTRVASEQRISTTKVFCPSAFTTDGHELNDLGFRVLHNFKSLDIILGLPTLKQLGVVIHPSQNTFFYG